MEIQHFSLAAERMVYNRILFSGSSFGEVDVVGVNALGLRIGVVLVISVHIDGNRTGESVLKTDQKRSAVSHGTGLELRLDPQLKFEFVAVFDDSG